MVLIPVVLFILIEAGLKIFGLYPPMHVFVSTPDDASVYYGINTQIGERYFPKGSFRPTPRKDLFLKEKPENGFRIFILGGSTAAGFPFGNNLTFPRILNRRLADAFPDRRIEVVNMAMTAINTFTLLDFMDEILKQKPDALFIYAGHNEFYGGLGAGSVESAGRFYPVTRLYLKLQRFRTFLMLRDAVNRIRPNRKTAGSNDPMATIMSRIVEDKTIPEDSGVYRAAEKQFRNNLGAIAGRAGRAGIPVIMSELVSNLRDQPPFIVDANNQRTPAAIEFLKARKLEQEKRYREARNAYETAKDLDMLRFRAPEDFNRIIHEIADTHEIPVIPMKAVFENASPNGLTGHTLMADHLHPNKKGYFLMADAFYSAMKTMEMIEPVRNDGAASSAFYQKNWGFTCLDSTYAAMNILHLKGGWPFKKSGPNLVLQSFRPKTAEDTLALQILTTGQTTLEMGHIELARKLVRKGQFDRAMDEYKALIYTVPNLDLFYEPAVSLAIHTGQYDRILKLLLDGLHFNTSFFMLKWTGQIDLVLNRTDEGISILERAYGINPNDEHVLFNLARAYYNNSRISKGDALLNHLRQTSPLSPLLAELSAYRNSL